MPPRSGVAVKVPFERLPDRTTSAAAASERAPLHGRTLHVMMRACGTST